MKQTRDVVLGLIVFVAFTECACILPGQQAMGQTGSVVVIPQPPVVVFQSQPELVPVPRSRVYYAPRVDDYDLYRLDGFWYLQEDGQWFRARGYRGPFQYVDYARLPPALRDIPPEYCHHTAPAPRQPHQPHQPHQPLKQQRDWGGYDPRD